MPGQHSPRTVYIDDYQPPDLYDQARDPIDYPGPWYIEWARWLALWFVVSAGAISIIIVGELMRALTPYVH